jgi:hypothetical protein
MATSTNPWNAVYKFEARKSRSNTQITTLRKPNGLLTADIRETIQLCWSISPWKTINMMTMTKTQTQDRLTNL